MVQPPCCDLVCEAADSTQRARCYSPHPVFGGICMIPPNCSYDAVSPPFDHMFVHLLVAVTSHLTVVFINRRSHWGTT